VSRKLEIKIKLDGTEYDISNDVIINSFQIQERGDLVFECGGFDFVSSSIIKNIPPFTYCHIADKNIDIVNNEEVVLNQVEWTFLIESEVNINLLTKKAYHTCKLLDTKAILECYVVGTKTHSLNGVTDFNFLKRCYEISIPNGDPLNVTQTNITTSIANEYTFGSGTTLYDVFKTVTLRNNWAFVVYFAGADVNQIKVQISNKPSARSNYLSTSKVLQFRTLQNADNYSKHLVSEASNVVDRAQETRFIWLRPRSEDATIDSDNCVVKLPTKVEAITSFKVYGNMTFYIECSSPVFTVEWMRQHGAMASDPEPQTYTKTLQEWINLNVIDEHGVNVFYGLYELGLNRIPNILNSPMCIISTVNISTATGKLYFNAANNNKYLQAWGEVDYTERCVDDEYYNALAPNEQPIYITFKSGGDVISNLNKNYKKDFWNDAFKNSVNNFLNMQHPIEYTNSNGEETVYYQAGGGFNTVDPMNFVYTISCIPISSPKIYDTKNFGSDEASYLVNETSMKPMTRTYQMGSSNSLPVDFKLLYKDMDAQNETLGRIEAMALVDTTDRTVSNLYKPDDYFSITIANNSFGRFYVSSLVHRYSMGKRITQLNLSKTRNKIADAIGVDYQYNSTKYAMQNVVDRPLYFELSDTTIFNAIASENNLHLKFDFYKANGDFLISLLQRATVLKPASGNIIVLYCEAVNNYVWAYKSTQASDSYRLNEAVKYTDDVGEVGYVSISVIKQTNYDMNFDYEYPLASALNIIGSEGVNYFTYEIVSDKYIAKDERERLSFTVKIMK